MIKISFKTRYFDWFFYVLTYLIFSLRFLLLAISIISTSFLKIIEPYIIYWVDSTQAIIQVAGKKVCHLSFRIITIFLRHSIWQCLAIIASEIGPESL